MAPAQGPTLSGKAENATFINKNSEKKNGKKTRRKAIALDPLSLTFLTTRCKHDGKEDETFKRNVDVDFFSAVLESVKPAVFFALDTKIQRKGIDIQSFKIPGYQLHHQEVSFPSGGESGGTIVYTHNVMKCIPIHDLESNKYEAVWLKLTHPDPIYDEKIDDDSGGIRVRTAHHPVTIVGNVRCHSSTQSIEDFVDYAITTIQKGLAFFPSANIILFGECFTSSSESLIDLVNCRMTENNFKTSEFVTDAFSADLNKQSGSHDAVFRYYFTIRSNYYKDSNISFDVLPGTISQKFLSVTAKRNNCPFCQEAFISSNELYEHRKSLRHRKNHCAALYYNNRKSLIDNKHHLAIDVVEPTAPEVVKYEIEDGKICLNLKPGIKSTLRLKIKNDAAIDKQAVDDAGQKMGLVIKSIEFLRMDQNFSLTDKYGFCKPVSERPDNVRNGIRLSNGSGFEVDVEIAKYHIGQYRMPLIVQYRIDPLEDNKTVYHLARELFIKVSNSDVEFMKPTKPYEQPKPIKNKSWGGKHDPVPGKPLPSKDSTNQALEMMPQQVKLDQYKLSHVMEKLLTHGLRNHPGNPTGAEELLRKCQDLIENSLNEDNYKDKFKFLVQCEEHQMNIDIRNYDMEDVKMLQVQNRKYLLQLEIPGLAEKRPSVLRGDKIYVTVATDSTLDVDNLQSLDQNLREYEGFVHEVEETRVLLGFSDKLMKRYLPNMKFNIRFTISRFPLRNMYRAIENIEKGFLFPNPQDEPEETECQTIKTYFNRDIEQNLEQKLAVNRILSGGKKGIPYIVFGPPGTGKTVTIVEAIKQIWHAKPGSNILATAPSNSAADLLAHRLIGHIPKTEILRYYAPTRAEKDIPEALRGISNYKIDCSNPVTVMKCRVVVVTLVTAGRLVSAGIPQTHFSHCFLDEAGHAMEPEACVALSGILEHPSGQLILAGDPKQLGPVLRSPIALKCGLQISLLERLMASSSNSDNKSGIQTYQRDLESGKYDDKAITKLLSNFRSHPALLQLPSRLFYDNELLPKGDPLITTSLEGWEKLPNNKGKFPMIFHGIIGEDKREARSPSFFNAEEAVLVVDYIQDLLTAKNGISKKVLPKEIGVISPYRRQVEKIRSLMNRRFQNSGCKTGGGKHIEGIPETWKEVTVGSTEEFQGQERRVIIITTVRSQPHLLQHDFTHKLGFLRNPKRFNVAITRAKALLIVVGNPNLLSLDSYWREFIRYTIENGGYTGVNFNLPPEVSSGVEKGAGRDCIDQMQDLEFCDMERKFREMGFVLDEAESSNSDESDILESFEKLDLDEISQQEYQESHEWRNEC